jgi:hypothetical protein
LCTFKVAKRLQDLHMVSFLPDPTSGWVTARSDGPERWTFQSYGVAEADKDPVPSDSFVWITEFRDLWAQWFAHRFAAEASRIGTSDSEWFRRVTGLR